MVHGTPDECQDPRGRREGEGHYGAIPVGRHGYASESEEVGNIKDPSESLAVSNIRDITSHMPKGGQLSPTGDLGELRQLEALKVFPDLQKMTDHVKRSSRKIPLKEPFAK
jgi:hypothetical protein